MRCKALAVFDSNRITSCIPGNGSPGFWAKTLSNQLRSCIKQEIKNLFPQLESGDCIIYPSNFGFTHLYKIDTSCCVIITDEPLSPEQLKYLSLYALSNHIPLKQIMQDTETFTTDFRSSKLKAILHPFLDDLKNQRKSLEKTLRSRYSVPKNSNNYPLSNTGFALAVAGL